MEDKYLRFVKNKYDIHSVSSISSFMKIMLNKILNDMITNDTKINYLNKFSNHYAILESMNTLGYYVIRNNNDENKRKQWSKIIEIIDEFKNNLKNIKQIKRILLPFKKEIENKFKDEQNEKIKQTEKKMKELKKTQEEIDKKINEIKSQTPQYDDYLFIIDILKIFPEELNDDVIGQLTAKRNNNKEGLIEFKNSETLIKLNKGLVEDLNKLNVSICCVNSDGEMIFSNEIKGQYQNYRLLVNLDNIDFFMKNLKPKYSSYIMSLFFSANNKYITNYIYYHLNNFSILNKTNTLKDNEYITWISAINQMSYIFRDSFTSYITRLVDYCNVKDIDDVKYENVDYYLQELLSVNDINVNELTFDFNKRIFTLLCSCFDLKLTTKHDKVNNVEYFKINSNRLINGKVNKEILLTIKYNKSINFEYVNLDDINTYLISIPSFLTNNNKYNNKIILYLQELINTFADVIFDLINPLMFCIHNSNKIMYHSIFNKFCFYLIFDYAAYVFNCDKRKEIFIKRHLSIKKAFEYNNILLNMVFNCKLLNPSFNKSFIEQIKNINNTINIESIREDNMHELLQKEFNGIYDVIFGYTDKMNVFNPLLTFDKNYIKDIKLEFYTMSIYQSFKQKLELKKKDKMQCTTIYNIMDIDNFSYYLEHAKDRIAMNAIVEFFFVEDYIEEHDEEETELLTETCIDINNVITKEMF